jgi:hypothetical protein
MLTITIISAILAFTPIALASPVEKRDPGNFRLFEHHYFQRMLNSFLLQSNADPKPAPAATTSTPSACTSTTTATAVDAMPNPLRTSLQAIASAT